MQSHWNAPSRRIPPPDIVRPPQITSSARPLSPPSPHPEFLIVGLFALRLTKRLIQGLEYYPGRDDDITWLANFVAPYPIEFALAKISGQRKEDYTATYQDIVSRMKRQSRYPVRFMQMSPDQPMRHQQVSRGVEREGPREMTDLERLDIIDFCDAAGEWGSVVPIPAKEADRMIELADRRRIADVDNRIGDVENRRLVRDERHHHEERRR